jgi:hypothetical protein
MDVNVNQFGLLSARMLIMQLVAMNTLHYIILQQISTDDYEELVAV